MNLAGSQGYTRHQRHEMVIANEFRRLFPTWNEKYSLKSGVVDLIVNYLQFNARNFLICADNIGTPIYQRFPNLSQNGHTIIKESNKDIISKNCILFRCCSVTIPCNQPYWKTLCI